MAQSRRFQLTLVGLAMVATWGLCRPVLAKDGPFGLIHVAANRSQYTGTGCPIEIVFTASINFEMPHRGLTFNYHWERSDGSKSPEEVMRPADNQRSAVVHATWKLGGPGHQYEASDTLFVNSGNTHLSEASPVVHVVCR